MSNRAAAKPLLVLAALAAATSPDLGSTVDRLKQRARDGFTADPMGSVLATVIGGAWLFYKAEKGKNPKVNSFYDALVYVSTNLSVGYSDIFAKTPAGKVLGSALMTYGPAMATKIFDPPARSADAAPNDAVVERLDKILAALEALSASRGAA